MRSVLAVLRSMKLWQAGLSVMVLAGSFGVGYQGYAMLADSSPRTGLKAAEQVVVIQRSNLVNQVSTNGALAYSTRETVNFGAPGIVGTVFVKVGDRVTKGHVLATLDAATLGSLAKAVPQAQLALKNAEDALASAKGQATQIALKKAQLEATMVNARVQVRTAEDAVATTERPFMEVDFKKQEEAILTAQLAAQTAEDNLEKAKAPYTASDLKTQEQLVAASRVALKNAQDALATARVPFTKDDVDAATVSVQRARETLTNSLTQLQVTKASQVRIVDTAQTNLTDKKILYRQTMLSKYGIPVEVIADKDLYLAPEEIVTKYFSRSAANTGDPVVAWKALILTKEGLDSALLTQANAIVSSERSIDGAKDALKTAEATLIARLDGADQDEVDLKEAQAETAQFALDDAIVKLADMRGEPSFLEVAVKAAQVATAQANLLVAEDKLADMHVGGDALDVAAKVVEVTVAKQNLAVATEEMTAYKGGPDTNELAILQSDIDAAELALDTARLRQEGATPKAPFAGSVTQANVTAAQNVGINTIAFEVADPSTLALNGTVDEIDVLQVQEGFAATVTLDALPGQTLTGKISSISSTATTQSGVVTYSVTVEVQAPEGTSLREGLSGVATIVIRSIPDVLLAPQQAIRGTNQAPYVQVLQAGKVIDLTVALGESDNFWVVVSDGLREGDQVVMPKPEANAAGQTQIRIGGRGNFGITGGGISVGGGGQGGFVPGGAGRPSDNQQGQTGQGRQRQAQ